MGRNPETQGQYPNKLLPHKNTRHKLGFLDFGKYRVPPY